MAALAQLVLIGLLAGGIYAAVGVGFGLVWGVLNIVNLAHGALVIIGAYLTWQMFAVWGVDPFLTLPIDAIALFVLGYAVQRGVINRIIRAPLLFTFLLTFGLNLIAVNVLLLIFKSDFRSVTTAYSGAGLELGGLVIPYIRLAALAIALVMAALLAILLSRTRVGLAIQAVGSDRGEPYTLQAFVVVILGGLGRVSATVVGGLVFGLVEAFGQSIPGSGSVFANAIAFGVMVVILVTRPQGLMGRLR
ncbi:MAG: hypothetical protein AUI15_09625 [Actinobacteria bacterium 13_2_20CM_2_66_6]|nr:MAG: hypothetical protein AUI15_09625 [Actinobacteria bacterium 13_2_20CM_2_66_6]